MNLETLSLKKHPEESFDIKNIVDKLKISKESKQKLTAMLGTVVFGICTSGCTKTTTEGISNSEMKMHYSKLTPDMQKQIKNTKETIRTNMNYYLPDDVQTKLGDTALVPMLTKTNTIESIGENQQFSDKLSSKVPMSAKDIYMISYNITAAIEGGNHSWQMNQGETKMLSPENSEVIKGDGTNVTLKKSGLTKKDAVLHALSSFIQSQNGTKIEKDVKSISAKNGDEIIIEYSSLFGNGYIEEYEVRSIEKDPYGHYIATVEIVPGSIQQITSKLPNNHQSAN